MKGVHLLPAECKPSLLIFCPTFVHYQASEVNLTVEKSLAERAAEAEKKLSADGGKALLFTQPPQSKRRQSNRL